MKTARYFFKLIAINTIVVFLISASTSIKKTYQPTSNKFEKALKLEEENNYKGAILIYKKLASNSDKESAELLYHLGTSQLNLTRADSAIASLDRADKLVEFKDASSDLNIDILLTLGKSYQLEMYPNKAIDVYNRLLSILKDSDTELKKEIEEEIRTCKNAQIYMDNPAEITIKNLGPNINSASNDHTPIVTLDENQIYYTSRQKSSERNELKDGSNPEKIYHSILSSKQWSKNYLFEVFFRNFENESALSLSSDGTELFLFRNDDEGQSIYETKYDGKKWAKPFKLPPPINSPANETHACLSPDKSTIFFTSDRVGGMGGKDIYLARKLKDGNWGSLTNLGPNINSEVDEETPIFHYDGKTLYFASEGHNSMGRMDVFYSQMNPDSTWNEPVNLGYPINSPDDDFSFAPNISKDHAFYSSSRQGQTFGGSDIYRVEFKKFVQGDLAVIEGTVIPKSGESLEKGKIRIMVSQTANSKLVGNYTPDKNGKYMMFLEAGQEYTVIQKEEGVDDTKSTIDVSNKSIYKPGQKFVSFESLKIDAPLVEAKSNSNNTKDIIGANSETRLSNAKTTSSQDLGAHDSAIRYTIQVLALKRRSKPFKNYFKSLHDFTIKQHRCIDGYTRFSVGSYKTQDEAMKNLVKIQEHGQFKDAFIRNSEHKGEQYKH